VTYHVSLSVLRAVPMSFGEALWWARKLAIGRSVAVADQYGREVVVISDLAVEGE